MGIIDIPRAVLRMQYRIARTPLALIEQRYIANLDPVAPGRLLFERSFGALDVAIGRTLGDRELARRGDALAERSELIAESVRLEAEAEAQRELADDELAEKRDKAANEPTKAHAAAKERIDRTRSEATEQKQDAAREVANRTAASKAAVEQDAQREIGAVEKRKDAEKQAVSTVEAARRAEADEQLDEAAQQRAEAADKRLHAERLDDFAETEKRERQRARDTKAT